MGAELVGDAASALAGADVVLRVGPPSDDEVAALPGSALLISYLRPLDRPELIQALAARGISALAVELVPRITRAQTMDALSSQANIAGYRAVLVAATLLPRYFPLLMTAAGTVPPARVLVLGAGVAGLQAIATARRLGAVVSAFDVRPAVREQVESLGATFLEVDLPETGETSGGYAQELSADTQRRQRELLAEHVAASDVVVTTALVPGRPAPQLIGADMVAAMRPGSVIVDLAAEAGGNCELTEPGATVVREHVTIVGDRNPAAAMPYDASRLYARNLTELLGVCLHDGRVALDAEDAVIAGCLVCHGGVVVHPAVLERI
jgi:NAD(P) transhydrogenase subunit alpha